MVCVLLCVPPLIVRLADRPSTHTMEHVALVSSQETWLRAHAGEPGAWAMPTNNGVARIVKPPLLVWMNLIAWSDLAPEEATPEHMLERARIVSVLLGALMLGAVFWLGWSLGGVRLAVLSTLVMGAMLFFQKQARIASYDVEFTALATMSVAAGYWALGLKCASVSTRRFLGGWITAGFFMALSWMTKNPLALVLAIPPLAVGVAAAPERRRGAAGLGLAIVVCLLTIAPWHIYAFMTVPGAWDTLLHEFKQPRGRDAQPVYYYIAIFGLVFPWCFYLAAGLFHPFDQSWRGQLGEQERASRRVRLLPWLWFMWIWIFFSLAEAKQQRYILPIVAPAALMIARVWCDHDVLLRRAPQRIAEGLLRVPHWVALTGLSLVILAAGVVEWTSPGAVVEAMLKVGTVVPGVGELSREEVEQSVRSALPFSTPAAMLVGAVLVVLAWAGWRLHARAHVFQAGIVSSCWALLASCLFWFGYSGQPTTMDRTVTAAAELRRDLEGAALKYPIRGAESVRPEEEFRFYLGSFIHGATAEEMERGEVEWVIAMPDEAPMMRELGFTLVRDVPEGPNSTRQLWRFSATP